MSKPGPKPKQFDDPEEQERWEKRRRQRRESYHRNLERNREYNREYKRKRRAEGHSYYSSEKERAGHFRRKYGITIEQYEQMSEAQGGVCAACGSEQRGTARSVTTLLDVDHCHETGKVRGLLCNPCNLALGLLGDSQERVAQLLAYIQHH